MQSAGMSSIIRTFVDIFYICILHHLLDQNSLSKSILNKPIYALYLSPNGQLQVSYKSWYIHVGLQPSHPPTCKGCGLKSLVYGQQVVIL